DPNNPGAFRHFREVNYFGRLSTYFNLTPNWQLEGGVSGLINPGADDRGGLLLPPSGGSFIERERRVGGVDLKLSYVPLQHNQIRLQYTHTDHSPGFGLRSDDAIYLQWAWIIGSHAHGWQQR